MNERYERHDSTYMKTSYENTYTKHALLLEQHTPQSKRVNLKSWMSCTNLLGQIRALGNNYFAFPHKHSTTSLKAQTQQDCTCISLLFIYCSLLTGCFQLDSGTFFRTHIIASNSTRLAAHCHLQSNEKLPYNLACHYAQGWPELYIFRIWPYIYGDFLANNNAGTPYAYTAMANPIPPVSYITFLKVCNWMSV